MTKEQHEARQTAFAMLILTALSIAPVSAAALTWINGRGIYPTLSAAAIFTLFEGSGLVMAGTRVVIPDEDWYLGLCYAVRIYAPIAMLSVVWLAFAALSKILAAV